MKHSTRSGAALFLILLSGCGSAPKHAEQPSTDSERAASGAPPAGASAAAPAQETLQMVTDWQLQFDQALADTDRLDCPSACRALGSLERSASTICGMVGPATSTCSDVQRKREDARTRVHERCGVFP